MPGGPRAPSRTPGVFHAKLLFDEELHSPGSPVGVAALTYACQVNPTGELLRKSMRLDTPISTVLLPDLCKRAAPDRVALALRTMQRGMGLCTALWRTCHDPRGVGAGDRVWPPVRMVLFAGRTDSNVFVAHWFMIENFSQRR
jgi:hypothetical protein